MPTDSATQVAYQHLGTQTYAEIRFVLSQGNLMPIDLVAHTGIIVIGTHRPTEHDSTDMVAQCRGKRITQNVFSYIKFKTGLLQHLPDPSGA